MQMMPNSQNILIEHLSNKSVHEINEEFNNLHTMLRRDNIRCDFGKCSSIRRYHRIRENIDNLEQQSLRSHNLQFYIDLMDTIHCYFIHSFDLGMRIKFDKYYDKDNKYLKLKEQNGNVSKLNKDILVFDDRNTSDAFIDEMMFMLDDLENIKHCNSDFIALINVLSDNMILDKVFIDNFKKYH